MWYFLKHFIIIKTSLNVLLHITLTSKLGLCYDRIKTVTDSKKWYLEKKKSSILYIMETIYFQRGYRFFFFSFKPYITVYMSPNDCRMNHGPPGPGVLTKGSSIVMGEIAHNNWRPSVRTLVRGLHEWKETIILFI